MQLRTSRSPERVPPKASPAAASELPALLDAVIAGQLEAWQALQAQLAPRIERWARAHRAFRRRKLSSSIDDVRDVMVATLGRLAAADFQNLRRFRATHPAFEPCELEAWLYGSFDYALRQHLRARFGRSSHAAGARRADDGPSKRDLHTLAERLDGEPPCAPESGITTRICAREVDAFAAQRFSAHEVSVLRAYLRDEADEGRLPCEEDRQAAQRLLRKLKQRLRAHFKRSA